MANRCPIVLSTVCISEHLWAVCKISYYDLMHQLPRAAFSKSIYAKWNAQILQQYGARLGALGSLLKSLLSSGYPIDIVPDSMTVSDQALDRVLAHMLHLGLTPGDAIHLALAELCAQTFITADHDYSKVAGYAPGTTLAVLHVTP